MLRKIVAESQVGELGNVFVAQTFPFVGDIAAGAGDHAVELKTGKHPGHLEIGASTADADLMAVLPRLRDSFSG